MPAYLPPLSRREFLGRLAVVSSVLGMSPALLAAGRGGDKHAWALLADTHIPADPAKVTRKINMVDHFCTVAVDILDQKRRPAGLIVAGDCALNSGEAGDYVQLEKLLAGLRVSKIPLHLLLGNHDNRERFWAAFPKHRNGKVPDKHASVVKSDHVNWFLLDSLETTNVTPGLLGDQQLRWLARELDRNASKPAVVVAHHNPGMRDAIGGLKDTEPFYEVIRPRRHVKALAFGHTHNWEVTLDSSGIYLINLPPTAYVFRENMPSGWVQARTRRDGMDLELRSVDKAHPQHGEKMALQWRV